MTCRIDNTAFSPRWYSNTTNDYLTRRTPNTVNPVSCAGEDGAAAAAQLDEDHPFRLAQREDMRALAVTLLEVHPAPNLKPQCHQSAVCPSSGHAR